MLLIRLKDVNEIIAHSKEEQPNEACGILAGRITKIDGKVMREVLRVYKCKNELNSPIEYRISGEEQLRAFNEIEKSGLDLLGFYHSHPHTDSRPSSIDKERGNYIGYSYMIVSLSPVKVSSWVLEEDGFKEEEIYIIPD